MNLRDLQNKLIVAARKQAPEARVPYAFEKRIMARLAKTPRFDEWGQWVRSLWYGAAVCASIALLMSIWSVAPETEQEMATNFSQGIEQTILAAGESENLW